MFGTIGSTKNERGLRRLRNIKDLTHDEFNLEANILLEDYTFFFLNYNTGVISVLNSKGAPSIKNITKMFINLNYLDAEIYPIKNNDILGKLKEIDEVGAVSFRFAVPPNKVLGIKTPIRILNDFNKNGFDECEVIFYLSRKNINRKNPKNILDQVLKTYDVVKESDNEFKLEQFKLLASPEDERQQMMNLLELYFTKGVQINIDEDFSETSILNCLSLTYNEHEEEILKNVQLHI